MFRFTIRDVLWLTVVVALGAAWAAESSLTRYDYDKYIQENINFKWAGGYELGRPLVAPNGDEPRQLPMLVVCCLMVLSFSAGIGARTLVASFFPSAANIAGMKD